VPVINACTGTDLERLTRYVCSGNNQKEAGKRKILHQWAIKIGTVKVQYCYGDNVLKSVSEKQKRSSVQWSLNQHLKRRPDALSD
jgi:hypothetical protein